MTLANGEAVERVAREFVRRHGQPEALRLFSDHAEVVRAKGDELSATAWATSQNFVKGMQG